MAASTPAATCGPAGRGCASWLSTRKARASCPTFLVAERHKAKVCDVLLVLIGGILPPVGERGGGCFRKWALDASVARRAKA